LAAGLHYLTEVYQRASVSMTKNVVTPFVLGNKLWMLRERSGPLPTFENNDQLIDKAIEYFEWCEENPIEEMTVGWYQGEATEHTITKMRAFTIAGLCAFIGVDRQSWAEWRKRDYLATAVAWIDDVMYEQKFTGAAAGILNQSIIARDLGLAEKSDHTSSDGSMTPKPTVVEFISPQVTASVAHEG
jgi:hypothetical protein